MGMARTQKFVPTSVTFMSHSFWFNYRGLSGSYLCSQVLFDLGTSPTTAFDQVLFIQFQVIVSLIFQIEI